MTTELPQPGDIWRYSEPANEYSPVFNATFLVLKINSNNYKASDYKFDAICLETGRYSPVGFTPFHVSGNRWKKLA